MGVLKEDSFTSAANGVELCITYGMPSLVRLSDMKATWSNLGERKTTMSPGCHC